METFINSATKEIYMKVHNAVVGMEVQVKRDCRGHSDEFIKGGLVCTVDKVMGDAYELRLRNPDIDMGFAWVNASDVRRYIKPTKSPFDVAPVVEPDDIVELREDCTAKHGELIPQGLYIVEFIDEFDGTCTVLTVHGGYGQASLPMAKVHKVGVCNATSG